MRPTRKLVMHVCHTPSPAPIRDTINSRHRDTLANYASALYSARWYIHSTCATPLSKPILKQNYLLPIWLRTSMCAYAKVFVLPGPLNLVAFAVSASRHILRFCVEIIAILSRIDLVPTCNLILFASPPPPSNPPLPSTMAC